MKLRGWMSGVVVGLFVAGCGAAGTSIDEEDVDEVSAEAALGVDGQGPLAPPPGPPGMMGRHGGPGRGGPFALFGGALHSADLSEAQKQAIADLMKGMRPKGSREAHAENAAALASAIRDNKVDSEKLRRGGPSAPEAMHEKLLTALDKLHGTLTKEQRAALADELALRVEDGPDEPPPAREGKGPLEHMLAELEVSDAQTKLIKSALAKADLNPPEPPTKGQIAEHKAREIRLFEAFARDDFKAAGALEAPPKRKHPDPLDVLEVVVPLLSVDQRDKLADRIESGPPGRPR